MTWILGSAVTFGYGALVSDVRASWLDEHGNEVGHLDVLQKIYPIGPWMMAGFAGSVQFGFAAIANLQHFFEGAGVGQAYLPEKAAWSWYRLARAAFAKASPNVQKYPASIILVGASPMMNGPLFHWSRCMRMRSPSFVPERIKGPAWTSIGTGSTHRTAKEFAEQKMHEFFPFAQGEIGNPGGAAFSVASTVGLELARCPIRFVSPQLQVGTAWLGKHEIKTLAGELHGPAWSGWRMIETQGLTTSWTQFQKVAADAGYQAASAAT